MQKRLPEIMLQKTVELGEHDDEGDGEVDGAGEEEPLEEEQGDEGDEGAQPETEIEPQKCGMIFTQSSSLQVVNIQCMYNYYTYSVMAVDYQLLKIF